MRICKNKWYPFDLRKGYYQALPKERKCVLVRMIEKGDGYPKGIAVGYLRFAAGDKQSPQFIVPGLHTGVALSFNDCLPDDFKWPIELEATSDSVTPLTPTTNP